jgi:hypothetical protein
MGTTLKAAFSLPIVKNVSLPCVEFTVTVVACPNTMGEEITQAQERTLKMKVSTQN